MPSVMATPTSLSPGSSATAMMPLARGRENKRQRGLLHRPETRRHEDELAFLELLDRQHGADALAFLERQQIHDGLAARSAAGLRQLIDLEPIELAAVGEAQQRVVSVGHEQLVDEILILDAGGGLAAAAAALRLIVGDRLRLGITAMRQRHHDILGRNQIFSGEIFVIDQDFRAALVAECVADEFQFLADHLEQPLRPREDVRQIADLFQQLLVFAQ